MTDRLTKTADEPLSDGATWLVDLVAAVDHLRRGYRPGLTVWDALEEAIRWTLDNSDDDPWDSPDPLAASLSAILDDLGAPVALKLQVAVRRWVTTMAARFNAGHHWPHPTARRDFPPPRLDALIDE
ncbi:MAG TPA: hypothetical protein VNQ73_02515 [Ilumatobacter sp.]|nr:hypothetical protein [Ilumatobacter sp.]